jgi:urease accessory protein
MNQALPPELLPYLDEPGQLPSGAPGKNGYLRLGFERRGNRTILRDLARRAPLIVQQALYWDEAMPNLPCVFMISNAGGILQADRYAIDIALGPGAEAHLTTQAATKIHAMDANYASQTQTLVLDEGAYLEYLPDPVIPHRHTRFLTDTRITLAPGATLLYAETLAAGRKYHGEGELFAYDLFSSKVTALRPDGRELFTEKFVVEPGRDPVQAVGVMGGYDVFANVLLLTPPERAEQVFAELPATVDPAGRWAAGASRLPNAAGLVYKVLGADTETVKARVRDFWALARAAVTGAPLMKEFLWR